MQHLANPEESGGARSEPLAARLDTALRTALVVGLIPPALLGYSLAAIALAGARPARMHRLYLSACRFCLLLGGTELELRGSERLDPGQAYVVVANHESGWDPLCLLVGLPDLVMRFVAKRQFMDIPVLGHALRLSGNIRVVRTATQGDVASIHLAMDQREPEVSILFFAEGHRSRDGALHLFKMGAFVTAIGYGLPILPIGIAGTRPIWEPEVLRIRKGRVAIEVGEPVPVEGLTLEDRATLRDRVFASVRELRGRARQHLRDRGVDPGGID